MTRRLTVWNPWTMMPEEPFDFETFRSSERDGISMDMYEEGDNVVVVLKAPGFSKDDVKIQLESNVITINGSVKNESEEENKSRKYYRKEIHSMSFSRTAELPASVKAEDAKAVFNDGMLTITLPKKEESKPKTITVDVA